MFLCFGKVKNQKMLASQCFLEENIPRYTRYRANHENNSNAKLFFGHLCGLVDLALERKGEFHWKKCSVSFNMMSLPHVRKLSCPCITMDVPCLCTFKNLEKIYKTTQLGFCHRGIKYQSSRQKKHSFNDKIYYDSQNRKPSYTLVLRIPFSVNPQNLPKIHFHKGLTEH